MTKTVKWITVPTIAGMLAIGLYAQQATTPTLDRKLSGNFENATLKEVLKWLSQQGVSFVVRADADGNARLSLNIQDQPIQDVMDAIASAFDTEWEKKGNTYVLKQSPRARIIQGIPFHDGPTEVAPRLFEGFIRPPDLKELEDLQLPPETFKELFKEGIAMPPMVFDEKEFKNWEQDPKTKAEWEKYAKDAEKWAREFEKKFSDPKFKADMEKRAAQLEKKWNDPKTKAEWEKYAKDAEKWSKELEKELADPKFKSQWKQFEGGVAVVPDGTDLKDSTRLRIVTPLPIKKLIGTITKAQWEKHAKQGHLTYADLTPMQKEMVKGMVDGGSWNLSFVIDGKKLNLRSK